MTQQPVGKNLGKYQESGVVWDLAPHDLAMLIYWTNIPTFADGQLVTLGYEPISDIASIHLRTGLTRFYYQLNVSWRHPIKERTTYIVGEKGMLVYDMMAKDKVVHVDRHVQAHRDGYHHIDGPSTTIPILDKEEPLFKEMKENKVDKNTALTTLAREAPSLYVPSLYAVTYTEDQKIRAIIPLKKMSQKKFGWPMPTWKRFP